MRSVVDRKVEAADVNRPTATPLDIVPVEPHVTESDLSNPLNSVPANNASAQAFTPVNRAASAQIASFGDRADATPLTRPRYGVGILSAANPVTHAPSDGQVDTAPISPSSRREQMGASKRCIPLFASVVKCPGRKPGHVCVNAPVSGFFRVCAVGHTQLPTSSSIFRRFVKGHLPD